MKKLTRKYLFTFLIFIGTFLYQSANIYADTPYNTYTVDHSNTIIRTQDAYSPIGSIDQIEDMVLKEPSDLFIDTHDDMYIVDTGNKRIIVLDSDAKLKNVINSDQFNRPTGIYVNELGMIYVADNGNNKVLQFDQKGTLIQEFGKPDSPLYGKNNTFKPQKVAVDKRGNLYVISEGTTNGVVQISPFNDFLGYFGSNKAANNLKIVLQRMFLTKEQLAKITQNIPLSPTNIAIDEKGLIYTMTQGDKGKSIKKLNISGVNLLPEMFFDQLFTDLFISKNGNIYAVSQKGFIYEYDSEGNLIFAFGGTDDGKLRLGLFVNVAGVAVDSKDHIYVLDKERNNIQIFEPTDFTLQVHEALSLYKEGFYIKSEKPWYRVLQMNNLFDLAHKGLGEAYYKQQMYTKALQEYKIAGDQKGFSNAFWEIRNKWLQEHLLALFYWILGIYVFIKLLKLINRKTGILNGLNHFIQSILQVKLIKEILFLTYFLKNPVDGFYGIKEEKKVSLLSATFLYLLFFMIYLVSLYFTGFVFKPSDTTEIMLSKEFIKIFAPFGLWVISNYLVSTINDGEGRWSDVYKATIYSFMPYLLFMPIVTILSNVLTINEAFIYQFSTFIIYAWSLLLLFIMVKEIHNYTFKESIKNILLTVFTMIILTLVFFIIYVLLKQVYDFVYSVIQEGIIRATQ